MKNTDGRGFICVFPQHRIHISRFDRRMKTESIKARNHRQQINNANLSMWGASFSSFIAELQPKERYGKSLRRKVELAMPSAPIEIQTQGHQPEAYSTQTAGPALQRILILHLVEIRENEVIAEPMDR